MRDETVHARLAERFELACSEYARSLEKWCAARGEKPPADLRQRAIALMAFENGLSQLGLIAREFVTGGVYPASSCGCWIDDPVGNLNVIFVVILVGGWLGGRIAARLKLPSILGMMLFRGNSLIERKTDGLISRNSGKKTRIERRAAQMDAADDALRAQSVENLVDRVRRTRRVGFPSGRHGRIGRAPGDPGIRRETDPRSRRPVTQRSGDPSFAPRSGGSPSCRG